MENPPPPPRVADPDPDLFFRGSDPRPFFFAGGSDSLNLNHDQPPSSVEAPDPLLKKLLLLRPWLLDVKVEPGGSGA